MKPLSISKDVWQVLRQIKKEQGFKHVNQAVKWLVEQMYYLEEETSVDEEEETNTTGDQPVVTNLPLDGISPCVNQHPVSGAGGHPRQRPYASQQQFFLEEKTVDDLLPQSTQIKCNWCGQVNIIKGYVRHSCITCPHCGRKIIW